MLSHLTYPYSWVECLTSDGCERLAHLDAAPEELNDAPVEWVKVLLGGNCDIGTHHFAWLHESTGVFHCVNGPAVENHDGMIDFRFVDGVKTYDMDGVMRKRPVKGLTRQWFVDGKQHRVDGPAVVSDDGSYSWFVDGERHRASDGGPAIKRANGSYEWLFKGGPWYDGRLFKWWWVIKSRCSM